MAVYTATTEGEVATSAAATNVALQLATTAGVRAKVLGFAVSFDGTSASEEPVIVKLQRSSDAGTNTGGGVSEVKQDTLTDTATGTVVKGGFSANPTLTDELYAVHVHPQGGSMAFWFPPGVEPVVAVSGWVNVVVVTPTGVNPNVVATLVWSE